MNPIVPHPARSRQEDLTHINARAGPPLGSCIFRVAAGAGRVEALESSYRVVALGRDRVLSAYPLARAHRPDLSLDDWRAESARHIDPAAGSDRGALVAESEHGYLTGLALHRADLAAGTLHVDCFIVLALVDAFGVAGALLGGLETVARACGCGEVQVIVPRKGCGATPPREAVGTTGAAFAFAGYGPAGILYRKRLD